MPHVIEPALGVGRCMLAFLCDSYDEEIDEKGEKRVVLRLHPAIAPIKVAVLPLSRNEKLSPTARDIHARLRKHWMTQYDDAQSIGRRYRRQDEIGTPLVRDRRLPDGRGGPGRDDPRARQHVPGARADRGRRRSAARTIWST